MLQSISLENFKGFKKIDSLKFKPITVLCGTNSSGKTSLLQSILLLKQTIESKNPNQTLLLNGRLAHLGTFENIVHRKIFENEVTLNFDFCITRSDLASMRHSTRTIPFFILLRDLFPEQDRRYKNPIYLISYQISLKLASENLPSSLKPLVVTKVQVNTNIKLSENKIAEGTEVILTRETENNYDIRFKNLKSRFYKKARKNSSDKKITAKVEFANLFPLDFSPPQDYEGEETQEIRFFFYRLNNAFQNIFTSFTYLGPLREEPSRRYIYEDEIIEIGIKGENAAYIYLSEKNETVNNHFYMNPVKDKFELKSKLKLSEALEDWLTTMQINGLRAEATSEIIRLNLDSNFSGQTRVNIADVGFGVSQIFPIILEGLRMPFRNTLILEQPEIHLHPNLQMKMADFLISLALSNKRVLVETHSDHIINRLVRRIVEDSEHNLNDLISIYFFNQSSSGSYYEEVQIDEMRGIVNWPTDFFDQTALEQKKILEAGINKRRSSRRENT